MTFTKYVYNNSKCIYLEKNVMMSDTDTYKDIFDRCKVDNCQYSHLFMTQLVASQLLQPAVAEFVQNESKLHLAVTHVTSSLNSTLESLEDIIKILEDKSGGN